MTGLSRQAVPVSRGSGGWVGSTSGGQDHCVGGNCSSVRYHSAHRAACDRQLCGPLPDNGHPQCPQPLFQCPAHIKGPVGYRKYPAPPLHLQRHAKPLKKSHGGTPVKSGKRTVEEFPIPRDICQQLLGIGVIGYITAPFARDIQFFAKPLIRLQQSDRSAGLRRSDGGHHSGSSTADNHNSFIHHRSCRILRTCPRCFPVQRRWRKYPFPSGTQVPPTGRS